MSWFDQIYEEPIPFGEAYPAWTRVSIETTGWCNRSCSFCPACNRRKATTMSDALYDSIVRQHEGFTGVVQWFYCNEPLLDKQHLPRIAQLREAAPKCTIHLTTNGQALRGPEHIVELFDAGVNSLNLNAYEAAHYPRYLEWADDIEGVKRGPHNWTRCRGQHLSVEDMTAPTDLHDWTGSVDVGENLVKRRTGRCARPHRHIVVCWDGTVPLCCAVDPMTCEKLGDANTTPLVDIWNSLPFFKYRFSLQRGVREGQCEGCHENMAFPHVVRRVCL